MLCGCLETTTEGVYCIVVEEAEECPTVDSVNESIFPVEVCGGTHSSATGFDERTDNTSVWHEDTASEEGKDACCFTTEYTSSNHNCVDD